MKRNRLIALSLALTMLVLSTAGCGGTVTPEVSPSASSAVVSESASASASASESVAPAVPEGDNMGRPYNTDKIKYDGRADKYLNGVNRPQSSLLRRNHARSRSGADSAQPS